MEPGLGRVESLDGGFEPPKFRPDGAGVVLSLGAGVGLSLGAGVGFALALVSGASSSWPLRCFLGSLDAGRGCAPSVLDSSVARLSI